MPVKTKFQLKQIPSWNEGDTKESIISYVNDVITSESQKFIPIKNRIAMFDNKENL